MHCSRLCTFYRTLATCLTFSSAIDNTCRVRSTLHLSSHNKTSVCCTMAAQTVDQRGQDVLMQFSHEGRLPQGIHAAAGNIDLLDEIIDEEPTNAESVDSFKETPLHIAATYGRFEIIKYLIREHQVKIDPVNFEGWTPLFCAISRGHVEIADFLLRNNANLNHITPSGSTVMHIAAYYNQPASIEFLINKQPSLLRKENNFGCTPIGLARPGPIKRLLFNAGEEVHE